MVKVKAFCAPLVRRKLFRLGENHLTHIDVSRQESGLAISEVVFPQPPEPVVEAERLQVRPGRAKVISPGDECLGIILLENALANDGNTKPPVFAPGDYRLKFRADTMIAPYEMKTRK